MPSNFGDREISQLDRAVKGSKAGPIPGRAATPQLKKMLHRPKKFLGAQGRLDTAGTFWTKDNHCDAASVHQPAKDARTVSSWARPKG